MSPSPSAPPASAADARCIAGRFTQAKPVHTDAFGAWVTAVDAGSGKGVLLRLLPAAAWSTPAALSALRSRCRRRAGSGAQTHWLHHLGFAGQHDGQYVLVYARPQGLHVPHMDTAWRIEDAARLAWQLAEAVHLLGDDGPVAGLRPPLLWWAPGSTPTSNAGLQIADFEAMRTLAEQRHHPAWRAALGPYGAPELDDADTVLSAAADVFSIAALLLLDFGQQQAALSATSVTRYAQARQLPPTTTTVLQSALDPNPSARPTLTQLQQALAQVLPQHAEVIMRPHSSLEIDLGETQGAVPSGHVAAGPLDAPRIAPAPAEATPAVQTVDLGAMLARITDNDAPRWMVVKDKLDHGPFTGRELLELIRRGEVGGDHGLSNMDTGGRSLVREHPELSEFVQQCERQAAQAAEHKAIQASEQKAKVWTVAKVGVALAVAVALVAAGTLLLLKRQRRAARQAERVELAQLYERGDVSISGEAGLLDAPAPARGKGRRRGGAAAAGGSYEAAMNQAVNLGDATQGGSQAQLAPAQVAQVMNRNVQRMGPCVAAELRRGQTLSSVQIDLAIAGSGRVMGASVRHGSPDFQRCVAARVRAIRFPTFPAPRMGARYRFQVDR
ncbi:MAG: hypothetical protein ACPGUV_00890 [Polyangiales bacterium]